MAGNRAALESIARKTIEVEIPEAATTFRLREMSAADRDRFEVASLKTDADGKRTIDPMFLRARLVAMCLVDDAGARLYADDEIEQLAGNVASVVSRLFEAAQKLNGMDAAAVDNAEKNFAAGPNAASGSG